MTNENTKIDLSQIGNHILAGRLFGLFFVLTFLSYGIGTGMVATVFTLPDYLTNIADSQTSIAIGVILMAGVHTALNIALPVLMMPILKPFSQRLAYGYLSASVLATGLLAVGAIFWLMVVPLGEAYVAGGAADTVVFETMGTLLHFAGLKLYQLGMAIWCVGGMMLAAVLYRSNIIPRFIPVWGMIGYAVFLFGNILALMGLNDGIVYTIPGGLFELFLSFWLIIKGFDFSKAKSAI